MNRAKRYTGLLLALSLWVITACGEEELDVVELQIGADTYRLEIAATPEERQRGLMFREELGDYEGMIFVFERDRHLSFWMKDTPLPLSIAYVSRDGTIKEIHHMRPLSTRPVESSYAVRYAIELPQGAFARSGARVGNRIDLGPLKKR